MKELVEELIKGKPGSPFLFIGSGFSRRYLGLEDWEGMLRKFCDGIGDFEFFLASANGDYPKAAGLLAKAFHPVWWKEDRYANSREALKEISKSECSALKNEISLYLQGLDFDLKENEENIKEISILKNANVDGIITTNWDLFIEEIFPEYKVYVGQEQLLFSNPQSIAEIYKIHGSCERPDSLVVTDEDYKAFHAQNPYLAAKLITIFIEHPIFFIGYSLQDANINEIIFSIASCLGEEKLEEFSKNLIFLKRAKGEGNAVEKHTFSREGRSVTATVLQTDEFSQVYEAIAENKRKIPARILRYCKEQMFELVKSSNPEEKLAVLDIDDLDEKDEVEFVVGVGVATSAKLAAEASPRVAFADSGYQGLDRADLFRDVVRKESNLDAGKVLKYVLPKIRRSGAVFTPLFRYLSAASIESEDQLLESEFSDAKVFYDRMKARPYQYGSTYKQAYENNWKGRSAQEVLDGVGAEKAAIYLAYLKKEELDQEWLRNYLEINIDSGFGDPYSSALNKLICYYDFLYFGFPPVGKNDVIAAIVG